MSQTEQAPRRVLVVGASDDERVRAWARRLPPGGLLICLDGDRAAAARAAEGFRRGGLHAAHVMAGDPARLVRKVAGPFDLILTAGAPGDRPAALRDKLAPGGRMASL